MKERAKAQRKTMTGMESNLWFRFLRKHQPRFRRKFVIGNYIADFYCSKAKLIIEVENKSRHSDLGLSYEKWNQRKSELQSNGVLRYSEADIFFNFNGVCKHIESITSERLKELGHEDLISESSISPRSQDHTPCIKKGAVTKSVKTLLFSFLERSEV